MLQQLARGLATEASLNDRDIGSWIGYPVGDAVKAGMLERKLYIQLYNQKSPPYRPDGKKKFQQVEITVPEPSRATVKDWKKIKDAVGGATGYRYGRFRTTVTYEGKRQTVVMTDKEDSSQKLAIVVSKLSKLKVIKLITTETLPVGVYAPGERFEIIESQIYPASYKVLEQKAYSQKPKLPAGKPNSKVATLKADLHRSRVKRVPLWTPQPPPGLSEWIDKMLAY
jgi:hypothetical protein